MHFKEHRNFQLWKVIPHKVYMSFPRKRGSSFFKLMDTAFKIRENWLRIISKAVQQLNDEEKITLTFIRGGLFDIRN